MNSSVSSSGYAVNLAKVVWREALNFKTWVVLLFAVASLSVLVAGVLSPKYFEASITVFADRQDFTKSAVSGQASITGFSDSGSLIEDAITSPHLLAQVVIELDMVEDPSNSFEVNDKSLALKNSIKVQPLGPNFVKISYLGSDAAEAREL